MGVKYPLYEVVKKGALSIGYQIEQYTYEGEEPKYTWRAGDGDESDQWFDSVDEAIDDVVTHYGA